MLYRLLLFLVRSLVDDPERVRIDRIETEKVDIFFIQVGKEDRGRILGRGGRTISALRTFLEGVAARLDREIVIELAD
ncbi:MAG TPA: KH domain-containing protein [Candidatus Acetothermia bacterium]|nr:KH domain-containing protein [Candidatus Bipolaricaulota bacterium]HDJ29821.1 KH domain-containing protein [Candidatus Acetothermia bacterium]